jgi:luciferase family oxidoreductase group 1
MRIGSGGVMLPHYSPFKVAESFSLLSGLFPDRIDLGIGRAAGTDPMTTFALQRDRRTASPDDFPEQLAELLAHYDGGFPDNHPFARLGRSLPGAPHQPEIWLLGSSAQSAIWAGQLGLPYALADFINPEGATNAELYRERFEPSGRLLAVPPPEKALRFIASTEGVARRGVIGSPETVRAGIETIASAYGAEEVIVVTITYDHGARRRSYELIADAFGVEPPAEAAVHAG